MRYLIEPKYRKYIKRYGFLSFTRRFCDKYSKKLIDTATKTGIDAVKTASKRVVQKTAEATGNLIGKKITDKITSVGKSKETTNKSEEIYIPPEKRQQIITDLKLFWIIIIIIIIMIIIIMILMTMRNKKWKMGNDNERWEMRNDNEKWQWEKKRN